MIRTDYMRVKYENEPVNITDYYYKSLLDISDEEHSRRINISSPERLIYGNWYYIDGNYYYYKNHYAFFELFCKELFNELGVSTVDFKPACETRSYNNKYGVMSKNFRRSGHKYIEYVRYINELYREHGIDYVDMDSAHLLNVENLLKNNVNGGNKLYEDLSKLIALDLLTGQGDRTAFNLLLDVNDEGVSVCPLCDNGGAFSSNKPFIITCLADIFLIPKCNNEFNRLIDENATFNHSLGECIKINIDEILRRTIRKYNIVMSKELKSDLINYIEERQEIIQKRLSI